ncbi:hypothetical protein LCGC14_2051790 [marine sediment metagenome]|uniref:Uncharacterized protein n=1 Tax=marine sediment metagenome TaxID=412755 RepID=A0A0F9HKV0_9ZZZZ
MSRMKAGKIPRRPPRRKPPRPGQPPGNTSTPPKAPPAPDLPTRDSSRKSFERKPNWLWKRKRNPDRSFALWGFAKHKWQSLDETDRVGFSMIGSMIWFTLWALSGALAELSILFMIPWIALSLIGIAAIGAVVKYLIKGAWNKYFPEYQEFKQEYKSKRKHSTEQMDSISDLFEDYEDDDIKEKPEGSYGTYWGAQSRERKKS